MTKKTIAQQINITAAKKNIPLSVFIEITHRCNLSCYYCYQEKFKPSEELTLLQWEKIIRALFDMGSLYITFSGGEPFLKNEFCEIISYARKYDFAISIITNGTLITDKLADYLKEQGIMDIGISFHGASEKVHDKLTNVPGSFLCAKKAVQLLVKRGIKVLIKHSVSNRNFREYKKLQDFAESEGCTFECDSLILPAIKGEVSHYALNDKQHLQFLQDMNIHPTVVCNSKKDCDSTLHCDAGRSMLGITPFGEVYPCIILPISFGNITKTPLEKIWYGKQASLFREQEKTLDTLCMTCQTKTKCSRCHAVSHLESLNWRGKSQSLCLRAKALEKLAHDENL